MGTGLGSGLGQAVEQGPARGASKRIHPCDVGSLHSKPFLSPETCVILAQIMSKFLYAYRLALALSAAALLASCSLKVENLPVNLRPELGEIRIQPEAISPLDTLDLSISASDPEGDTLGFSWNAGGLGAWVDGISNDSLVAWVAPSNLTGIDSVTFTVSVFDYDTQNPVQASRTLSIEAQFGELIVHVMDLDGMDLAVDSLAVLDLDTLVADPPSSSFHFTDVPWGIQSVLAFQSETHYGATSFFAGYAEADTIHPGGISEMDLRLAPRSLCVIPGVVGEGLGNQLLSSPQQGIDWCETEGLDTLYLRNQEYFLAPQATPRGSAGLVLDGRDLHLASYPGQEPLLLDAATGQNDIGFYLAGRGAGCVIEGIRMVGAADAGAWLDGSGGSFRSCRFEDEGSKGIHFSGAANDTLRLEDCALIGGEYGLFQEGGRVEAAACLVAGASWYGLYVGEGGAGTLANLTLVDHVNSAVYTIDAGELTLERSILAGCGNGCFTNWGQPPQLACNLFWDNQRNLYGVPGNDFIEEDPLFCDPDAGDWRVDAASPALGEPCGPMGAFGDCDSPGGPLRARR